MLLAYAAALTLAPWVRYGAPQRLPWVHWPAALIWPLLAWLTQHRLRQQGYRADPLWPLAATLLGLGLLTLYRLSPRYGLRQSLWVGLGLVAFHLTLEVPRLLERLRRYRVVWLMGGLALTALTLALGQHPLGSGPRLWLGCCGVYLQPSEPLKLIFLFYLAAYLAEQTRSSEASPGVKPRWRPWVPSTLVALVALGLLLAQRDLGTAAVFVGLYAAAMYAATGLRRWPAGMLVALTLAAGLGYALSPTIRLRVAAWIDPWADPGGFGYQPLQALMAVANGGLVGRGPGLGAPFFVPVAQSDFLFVALVEELGALGGWAVLGLLLALSQGALQIAARRGDPFGRTLAAGLAAYYGGQALLIVGGNLRLLPLTGVTLPFLSYGGSSLLTALLGLALLLRLERDAPSAQTTAPLPRPLRHMAQVLAAGFAAAGLALGYWALIRSGPLLARTDNPRRAWEARFTPRGALLDRRGLPWAHTVGPRGDYRRRYAAPYTGPVIGYANSAYGLAGLEAALDDPLRGAAGAPKGHIFWHRLLYGTFPPGQTIRLTLDAALERAALEGLGAAPGAAVLLDAQTGQVLVMASTPTFDPNRIAELGPALQHDPQAPLLNRTTWGQYAPGAAIAPWVTLAYLERHPNLPTLPPALEILWEGQRLSCALPPPRHPAWNTALQRGCPAPLAVLGQRLDQPTLEGALKAAGWFASPAFLLPTAPAAPPQIPLDLHDLALGQGGLSVSPLQMARAAAGLTAGRLPPLQIVLQEEGLSPSALPSPASQAPYPDKDLRQRVLAHFAWETTPFWGVAARSVNGEQRIAWFVGGTLPQGQPALSVAVALEDEPPQRAAALGLRLLGLATGWHPAGRQGPVCGAATAQGVQREQMR